MNVLKLGLAAAMLVGASCASTGSSIDTNDRTPCEQKCEDINWGCHNSEEYCTDKYFNCVMACDRVTSVGIYPYTLLAELPRLINER